jgi:hypothetical protein
MGPPIGPRSVRPGIAPEEGDRRPTDRPPFEQMPGERFARQATGAEPRVRADSPVAPEPAAAAPEAARAAEPWTRESPPQPAIGEPAHSIASEPSPPIEREAAPHPRSGDREPTTAQAFISDPADRVASEPAPPPLREPAHHFTRERTQPVGREQPQPAAAEHGPSPEPLERGASTAPQLRRFIKSRAYVPMHELRRRFGINGNDDDVTTIELERGRIYVGLPDPEGRLLGELLRSGDIGYELSMDPMTPIVVGVYPMRPVPRP